MPNKEHLERVKNQNWQKKWINAREKASKQLIDENGAMKRQQIDTWSAVDDLGLTPSEFRLLYCIARHEQWTSSAGSHKKSRKNGCYASVNTLCTITGISRNKIFEVLEILQESKIIRKHTGDDGKAKGRAKKGNNVTLAGWTYEYEILPITDWVTPWDLVKIRKEVLEKRKSKETKD